MREKLIRFRAPSWTALVAIFIALLLASGTAWHYWSRYGPGAVWPERTTSGEDQVDLEAIRPQVAAFCGDCHAVPEAASFPREAWYFEARQGFELYYESGRQDLSVPLLNDVVAYFRDQAPERLELSVPESSPGRLRFQRSDLTVAGAAPAVSFLNWSALGAGRPDLLLGSDMRSGDIRELRFDGDRLDVRQIARLAHPAHVTRTDLDGDGETDLLVAELGSFKPGDHQNGKVIWMRRGTTSAEWEAIVLEEKLGRVADVQPADFDGDGDLDLVVAEFGWRRTGRILLLEQITAADGRPRFEMGVLDGRHGTIHVPVADLNDDGYPDFVALISQEHEVVEAFLNRGDGSFRKERIFESGDPSFGSSGIQLVDLDGDGDLDVLYTNGDTLDSHHLKPFHAVHWLENRNAFPFTAHRVTTMPGVCRAIAGDLDNDGDLDIAACAAVLSELRVPPPDEIFDSLIWLEQTGPGRFHRHAIDASDVGYVALELGDFNDDGAVDLAAGRFDASPSAWMTIWWNRTTAVQAQ